ALRYNGRDVAVRELAVPANPAEALVRVVRSGICNTDLEIARGYGGFEGTIGHEFVGVVEKADDSPQIVGKRVVGEINAGCGECDRCLAGDPRHCPSRTVLGIVGRDGAHAEFLQLPSVNLLPVPDNMSDQQAVFAEPLAAAFGITEQVEFGRESKIAVIGDGKLGLLCAMSLGLRSEHLILIGKHLSKLKIAENAGAQGVLLSDISQSMLNCFDVVIEASGSESGFATALDVVRPRGKIVLKSTFHGTPVWAAARVVVDEITIVGSRCGRFAPALHLLESGSVNVDCLVEAELGLSNGIEAMKLAGEPGTLKVLLNPSG
ncbi:MAG: alcohol dehydrogenase catalytic domain-containing protein, partial [Pyrinomonadaceae bacterium]